MFVGQKVGPFEIESEIGSGAMGTVYRAVFEKDGLPIAVALKVIALGLLGNEGAMARFDRESAILKQLKHKNIVRLIATGRYKQTPFIAMEYIDGEPLDRVLARRGRVGWEEVVSYAKQLCDALQYAHEKGIIHRDLKPSNLMIMRDGTLKLTDFGIAKDVDVTALTGQNSTIGTAAYMSPEQCKGDRNLTNKSDLYSLGIVLYELITGKKPFNADTTVEMFLKHVNEPPVRPSRLVADLPVWLDNLIVFLLEKDKEKRPLDAATVGKMLEDIEEKVRTQHSAGQDVANARRMDRPFGDKELDETDRAAAKTLRDRNKPGRRPRKARPKKGTPWYEQAWLKAIPYLAVLSVVVGLLVYFLSPPSRTDLYNAWKNAGTPDAKIAAADRYLRKYGDQPGEETERVRAGLREANGEKLQAVLDKRFRNRTGAFRFATAQEGEDPDAYAAAWAALEAEDKGDLGQALVLWKKVQARAGEITDRYGDGWVWLADQHARDIAALDPKLAELRAEMVTAQAKELPWKHDPLRPESLAKLAIRLDPGEKGLAVESGIPDPNRKPLPHVSDPAKARRVWATLAELTKDKPELRVWNLLAVRERDRRPDVKGDAPVAARSAMLDRVLAAVEQEWKRVGDVPELAAEQRDCRNRCRDVTELYADETEDRIKKQVARADALLEKMKRPG